MSAASATGRDPDRVVWVVETRKAAVYHLSSRCSSARRAVGDVRMVKLRYVDDRRICYHCKAREAGDSRWQTGECRHCGLLSPGEGCPFCDRFDAVHDVPDGAAYCPLGDGVVSQGGVAD